MATRVADDLVVCTSSFFVGNRLVRAGDVWEMSDPAVRAYSSSFRPLNVHRSDPPKPAAASRLRPAARGSRKK